ncbi:MAG: ABC-2 transporter permease [Defluviitaleaceae bacterium]|nr:ABC-2 transporter permease [Defluviitaleaceae bacterium]MCL2240189.1 ABC-2 transporter permease [Defluviitaleaceae bacterium]MCL2240862.1 ABC-2 transporter permease [Defluviitaleaceae bacterium]
MEKAINFLKLDFMTARPGFNVATLGIQIAIITIIFAFSRDLLSVVFLIMLYMDSYVAMPFSIGETANMDGLYTILNVKRRTAVKCRYLYAGVIVFGTATLSMALVGLGRIAEILFGLNLNTGFAFRFLLIYLVISIIVQAMLLPVYYKFTIIKSGGISTVPFMAIMVGGFFLIIRFHSQLERVLYLLGNPMYLGVAVAALLAVLVVIVYISYRMSAVFYLRREF